MELLGICAICGRAGKLFTCRLCGRLFCAECSGRGSGICIQCGGGRRSGASSREPFDSDLLGA
ncbi:MAG: hypothetical protein WBK88_00810 [Methanothrix sp.]